MSYGHADNLASGSGQRGEQQTPPAERPPETPKADPPGDLAPDWYAAPDLAPVLTGRDIGALYRTLRDAGISQRQIAKRTDQSQSEVADIIAGRRRLVDSYGLLVRIAEGLGIPRGLMGLSFWEPDGKWYGPPDAYPGGVTVADPREGVTPAMLRRRLIAWGGIVMAGAPVENLGELLGELLDDLGELSPVSLPARITGAHVAQVQDLRQRLEESRRAIGGDPATSSAAAARAEQLLKVPGAEPIRRALMTAVAHLHIHAGVAARSGCLYARTLYHLAKALELARQAEAFVLQAEALAWAGLAAIEHGDPDDGLKMLQAAQVAAWNIPRGDSRRAAAEACPVMDSATALAMLGAPQEAYRRISAARNLWTPTASDPYGDMDRVPALLEIERGRLDIAEQFATASLRRWEGVAQVGRVRSGVILATVYVKAGERRGLQMAHSAITDTTKLTSARARRQLVPLVDALASRRGSDYADLARTARQVATARA